MATDSHDPDSLPGVLKPPDPSRPWLTGTWPTDEQGRYIVRDDVHEEDFELVLRVKLQGHGVWYNHGLGMFRRVQRELELMFGEGGAEVEWVSPRPGATPNSDGPESNATTGSPPNGAQNAEDSD